MHLLGPLILLFEYWSFSDSAGWNFNHPGTLYTWEGACAWIPCLYTKAGPKRPLKDFTLYHNHDFDDVTKNFSGTILYPTPEVPGQVTRVQYLGDMLNNCSLSIQPAHTNDSGRLGLRMTSETDRWMETINLNVSERPPPPHIQLPHHIQEFQEVTLTCTLNFACPGYPIQLQWSLEYQTDTYTSLKPELVSTESKLTFQPQWTHHGKNLTCKVHDPKTKLFSQQTLLLDVKHRPQVEIKVSPKEATVMKGESVTMTCHITSSNPEDTTISWFKDKAKLRKYNTATLNLPRVTKEDSGTYHCQASNSVGYGNSEDVVLQVQFVPEPSSVQILPLPAREGSMVELTCVSPAHPPPTNYTWYHNGKEVPGRTDQKFQIPKLLLLHAGNYCCLAENSLGLGQIGQEAELDVQYSPKGVTVVVQNPAPIREGDDVTLVCNYKSSNPRVTRYEWTPQVPRNQSFPEVLRIRKVTWDIGPIACQACNVWCQQAPFVHLEVEYVPRDVRVLKISPQTEIHSGQRVLLQCDFSSSRPPEVRFFWKKNGSLLAEGRQLSFVAVAPEDAGNYSCMASNSVGQTTSKAWRLHVLYAPRRLRVSMVPGDRVMEGKKAALVCESDANPPVSQFTWFDGNNENLHQTGQTLRLDPAQVQHTGAYRCQGANQLGVGVSPPRTLTVYYSPETIGKRTAVGIGACLSIFILAICGVKLRKGWKRIQARQGLQENSSGQSFFVRKKKVRRAHLSDTPASLGCYNPVMEDPVSYAALRFPAGETDTGGSGSVGMSASTPNREEMVTYSVLQKPPVVDYENVAPALAEEEEGIHYSELVHFGMGERPPAHDKVDYVTLKP
ncbi:B-cell receptor CD22 [Echinops telfairi]|uniref:B-cell receptor CD22 n=1 Tax=Echinops telfairi TaxID=9371 RepID=A0ABM1VKN3_ECHTE|nr:B-cell receptor CD22 [Echinops telfairi]